MKLDWLFDRELWLAFAALLLLSVFDKTPFRVIASLVGAGIIGHLAASANAWRIYGGSK